MGDEKSFSGKGASCSAWVAEATGNLDCGEVREGANRGGIVGGEWYGRQSSLSRRTSIRAYILIAIIAWRTSIANHWILH